MSRWLLYEDGGQAMSRTQWVFRHRCGCPFGVLEGRCASIEYDAWKEFYERVREIRKAQESGVTVEHMTHERFSSEVYPKLTLDYRCPHGTGDRP